MASKYRQRVEIGRDISGKPVYKWASGKTLSDLQNAIVALKQPEPTCPVFSSYILENFTYTRSKLTPKAQTAYESRIRRICEFEFASKPLDEITVSDLQAQWESLAAENYSKSYVRDLMGNVSMAFSYAVSDGYLTKNPMKDRRIHNPAKNVSEKIPWSKIQKKCLIESLDLIDKPSDRLFLAMLLFTPLRPSEIFGLMWDDIGDGWIRVRRSVTFSKGKSYVGAPKTALSTRDIPILPQLKPYLVHDSDGYVFHKRGMPSEPMTEQAARRQWERIGKQVNLYGRTPYCGRHTFATTMMEAGVPNKVAMTLMGHSDERMLSRVYQHADHESVSRGAQMVCDLLDSKLG